MALRSRESVRDDAVGMQGFNEYMEAPDGRRIAICRVALERL